MSEKLDYSEEKCECGNKEFVVSQGFLVCPVCGLCQARVFTEPDETLLSEDDHYFGGSGYSYGVRPDLVNGLGSYIGPFGTHESSFKRGIPSESISHWIYLSKIHNNSILIPKKDRSRLRLYKLVNEILGCIDGVSDTVSKSVFKILHRVLKNSDILKDYTGIEIVATSIELAFRKASFIYETEQLVAMFSSRGYRLRENRVINCLSVFQKLLKQKAPSRTPDQWLEHHKDILRSVLNDDEYLNMLFKVSYQVKEKIEKTPLLGGCNPKIWTAVAIYSASLVIQTDKGLETPFHQNGIAKSLGVAEYSFRDVYLKRFRVLFKNTKYHNAFYPYERTQ
jgi:hypothetical protein